MRDMNLTTLNFITNKVKIYFDMLHVGMKNQIGTMISYTHFVTINDRLLGQWNTKFMSKYKTQITLEVMDAATWYLVLVDECAIERCFLEL